MEVGESVPFGLDMYEKRERAGSWEQTARKSLFLSVKVAALDKRCRSNLLRQMKGSPLPFLSSP